MDDYGTIAGPATLRFERLLPGPIERVWQFLTERESLARWFYGATIPTKVGERVEWDFGCYGELTAYDPPHVLEYTWNEAENEIPVLDAKVRWELRAEGDKVHLTLTHSGIPKATFTGFGAGWHLGLDKLARRVAGDDGGPKFGEAYAALEADYAKRFEPVSS